MGDKKTTVTVKELEEMFGKPDKTVKTKNVPEITGYEDMDDLVERIGGGIFAIVGISMVIVLLVMIAALFIKWIGWYLLFLIPLTPMGYVAGTLVHANGNIDRFKKQMRKDKANILSVFKNVRKK